ncbi:hypothetical protein FKW50_13955 [Acetobacter pomorum]|nr:hypothetical protein DS739_01815 [Acetobacter sp. JWB]KAA8420570.1 hypothetical protein FKW54_13905 [Acetobacter pomorum]KAA8431201.1 hypothetical protein FKW50_13955 [Acetobacter pomorum]KAA8448351.1 hypothetical protein FKW52_13440 [Acetobacter pomorum]
MKTSGQHNFDKQMVIHSCSTDMTFAIRENLFYSPHSRNRKKTSQIKQSIKDDQTHHIQQSIDPTKDTTRFAEKHTSS